MRKKWFKSEVNSLSDEAETAKKLVERICRALSTDGMVLYPVVEKYNDAYEGHIICDGKCKGCNDNDCGAENGDYLGMIFWGGHFKSKGRRKCYDPKSYAWISLLEDCLGNGECGEEFSLHNYTKRIKCIPDIDFTCKTNEELECKLNEFILLDSIKSGGIRH